MAYERPKCCGIGLTLFGDFTMAVSVRVNGKPSMHRPQLFECEPHKLFCIKCKSSYYVRKDSKGRMLRGEHI